TCTGSNGVTCTASDACHTAGTCDATTGACSNPAKANGAACDDGNACTQADSCQGGACTGATPVTCSALDACHDAGTCDKTTGACSNPDKANGAACAGDANPCTLDQCQAGACSHPAGNAGAQCSASSCADGATLTLPALCTGSSTTC